jgi:hypothetical protein
MIGPRAGFVQTSNLWDFVYNHPSYTMSSLQKERKINTSFLVFWPSMPCSLIGKHQLLEEHTASIFKVTLVVLTQAFRHAGTDANLRVKHPLFDFN